jgi:hypothetical protein
VYGVFRLLLSRDADTPINTLYSVVGRMPIEGWPFLGDLLIDSGIARHDRPLVERLANLGPSSYAFGSVRSRALSVLKTWK